ncbi:MAG: oxidative stress defense protein [Vibrio sp.]
MKNTPKQMLAIFVCCAALTSTVNAAELSIPTLSTTGYGEVIAKPDMAEFSVAIQAENKQAAEAKKSVDQVVTKFIDDLAKQGVDRAAIQSGNLQLSPQYIYPKDQKPELTGYQAVRSITVKVSDLEKLNTYLDASLKAGVNRVDNIQLKVKDEAAYKKQARQAAIADAKEKAAELAKGFDAQLDGVWTIEYRSNTVRPVVMAKAMMMDARSANESYQDESMTISDQVNVVFKLKQANQ